MGGVTTRVRVGVRRPLSHRSSQLFVCRTPGDVPRGFPVRGLAGRFRVGLDSSIGKIRWAVKRKNARLGRTCARRAASTSARDAEKRTPRSHHHDASISVKICTMLHYTFPSAVGSHGCHSSLIALGVARLTFVFFTDEDGRRTARVASRNDGYRCHHTSTKCHKRRLEPIYASKSPPSRSKLSMRAAFFARRGDIRHYQGLLFFTDARSTDVRA